MTACRTEFGTLEGNRQQWLDRGGHGGFAGRVTEVETLCGRTLANDESATTRATRWAVRVTCKHCLRHLGLTEVLPNPD